MTLELCQNIKSQQTVYQIIVGQNIYPHLGQNNGRPEIYVPTYYVNFDANFQPIEAKAMF